MKLHHVGVVVKAIGRDGHHLAQSFGLDPVSEVIHDPTQGVNVQFWGAGADVSIEFIEPAVPDSRVGQFLEKGGGLAHICFEVPDLEIALTEAESKGAIPVQPPSPAPAFDGRRIAFLYYRGLGLVEFVEAAKP